MEPIMRVENSSADVAYTVNVQRVGDRRYVDIEPAEYGTDGGYVTLYPTPDEARRLAALFAALAGDA